jgi:hypothetical protein
LSSPSSKDGQASDLSTSTVCSSSSSAELKDRDRCGCMSKSVGSSSFGSYSIVLRAQRGGARSPRNCFVGRPAELDGKSDSPVLRQEFAALETKSSTKF